MKRNAIYFYFIFASYPAILRLFVNFNNFILLSFGFSAYIIMLFEKNNSFFFFAPFNSDNFALIYCTYNKNNINDIVSLSWSQEKSW